MFIDLNFDPAVGHPDVDAADALRHALTVLTALEQWSPLGRIGVVRQPPPPHGPIEVPDATEAAHLPTPKPQDEAYADEILATVILPLIRADD